MHQGEKIAEQKKKKNNKKKQTDIKTLRSC